MSYFPQMKLKKTVFQYSILQEVDFAQTDLTEADFKNCDLAGAIFDNSILEKADFREAVNFSIDPDSNRIKKAKFSAQELAGLLHKYQLAIY